MKKNSLKENMKRFNTKNLNKLTEQASDDQQKIASILKTWDWDVTIGTNGISGPNTTLPSFTVYTDNSKDDECIIIEVMGEYYFDPIYICYKDDAQFDRELAAASKKMFAAAFKQVFSQRRNK